MLRQRELLAASPEQAAAGLWGEKSDVGLAWLHGFVTGVESAAAWQRWFAADGVATMTALHRALWARAATDRRQVLARDLGLVETLKSGGLFDAAAALLDEAVLPVVGEAEPERFDLLLQRAEVGRRGYDWQHAGAALEAAGRLLGARPDRAGAAFGLGVQRAALLLARGLPDLALPEVEAAEGAAADAEQRARALFVRLRLEHLLRRPQRAVAAFDRFLEQPVPDAVAADPAWHRLLAQLRIRVALAVLADPSREPDDHGRGEGWLQAAMADASLPVDERLLARTVWITHRLDRGVLAGVADELDAAAREVPASTANELEERRLDLATLAVRRARVASAPAAELAACASRLDELWRAFVDRWQAQPVSRTGDGPLSFHDRRRSLVELLRSRLLLAADGRQGADQVLRDVVRAQVVGSLSKELGAEAPDAEAIRAALCPPGSGVLVYVPGHEASIAVAIDAGECTATVVPVGALAIDAARDDLLAALQDLRAGGATAPFAAAAQVLAAQLLPPAVAARLLRWRAVTVIGVESLGYVPFELLPGPGGARLGCTHALSYLPSLPVGVWLARHRPAPALAAGAPPRVLVVACPDAEAPADAPERPAPLPYGAAEAALLDAGLAGVAVTTLRGGDATAAACFTAGDRAALVHLLAHGLRDERRPDPQGLLFGDGAVLWPGDLGRAGAPPVLLISACRASRGRLRRGDDGRHGLAGAALLAGARAVVAPVLDVGYRSSLAFAADVHDGLWHLGLPLAEALRRARVVAQQRGGADALDACLHHLVGLGDAPLAVPVPAPAAPPRRWLWLAVGGVGAAAALALRGRTARRRAAP